MYVCVYVGHEPSSESMTQMKLNRDNMPHNPLVSAGAIVVASLLHVCCSLFTARRYASVVYAVVVCLSVRLSQAGIVLKRLEGSCWFSAFWHGGFF